MKGTIKRFTSLMLALLMTLALLPMEVLAAENVSDFTQLTELTSEAQIASTPAIQPLADAATAVPATFSVGSQTYSDLNDAITAAQSGTDKTIVVATDGSLSGSYTIPAGVTLLVPFDNANTLYTTEPGVVDSLAGQTAYRTLTLNSGASITVKGAISVGGKLFTSTNVHVCKPTGAYGQIKMSSGSQITVENGGAFYAWGYVTGNGNVRIMSGATVYECFQVTDWRGGSALMKFITPSNVKKVFPFSQYYVQNIEAPLTIEYGGLEYAYIAAYGEKVAIGFVGSGGMFELAEGATFTKTYDPGKDRISFDISGNASLKGIKLTVGITINSANYVLPINSNININIHSGTTTISQDVALLPGVQVTIDHGAELNIQTGANLYVYDADEWSKNYVWGSQNGISPVAYSPSGKGSRTISDVSINVNGTLNVNGSVYTTAGGADIYSSQSTGKFVQTTVPGTEKNTYQCTQSGSGFLGTKVTPVKISITPAKLHNADNSYTGTAGSKAGNTYVYANGKWALKGNEIAITFDPNGGAGSMEPMSVNPGVGNKLTDNTFTRENYTFTGWNTAKDGTGKTYADGETVNFSADTTLYAQWTQNPVITFDANGGTGTMGTQTVKPNEATALTANSFTRADYDFIGWNTAADGTGKAYADKTNITTNENVTLYAQWDLHKYHVRWLNWNDEVLQQGDYTCEEWAAWDDFNNETPSRPEDENYTYVFARRWTPYDERIDGWGFYPHKNVDFTAVFNKFEKLTVTFDANGGSSTMESVKIVNGASGEYYTLPECGFTREGYTFNGWLITGTVKMSVWDEEEKLNDEPWAESELLALSDLTLKASWKHSDGWFTDDNGKQYYKDGELQKTGWTVIDGKTYYLDTETGYAAMNGIYWLPYPAGYGPDQWDIDNNTNYTELGYNNNSYFIFDAEGVFQNAVSGFYTVTAGTKIVGGNAAAANTELTAWAVNGELPWHPGLVICNGAYYYFTTGYFENGNSYICGQDYSVSKPNDLAWPSEWGEGTFTVGKYTFDADGKLQLFDGFTNIGDETYYYVKGVKTYAGLIQIGDDYYYVNSSCKVIKGQSYTVSKTNGLLPAGTYDFDDNGKMIREDTTKNGIVKETEGTWYYYVNGVKTYAGLIQIGDDYYYVNSKFEVIHGRNYFISKTNGLMEQKTYYFDANGKLVQPDVKKNGIVKESDDTWYYYVAGVKTYAGLIQIDGNYYYVNSSFKVIHNQSYYVSKTNDLKTQGTYEFDANGKMVIATDDAGTVKNGIVKETEDTWYYYVDGTKTYAGLIVIDGSYYYVNSKFEVIHGRNYFISKTNGLLANGTYTFDEDGKMNT